MKTSAVLYRLVETADVFMTNFQPAVRAKLGLTLDEIRAKNPSIIYACADAVGGVGPEVGRPGYDATAYFARGGVGHAFRNPETGRPAKPRPGFGDKQGALSVAFGIASALYRRRQTGEPSLVEVSLLSTALWVTSSDLIASKATGTDRTAQKLTGPNPLNGQYRTADDRWLWFQLDELPRWWADFCRACDREDLAGDERFLDPLQRVERRDACAEELRTMFQSATLEEWRKRLAPLDVPWEPYQTPREILDDPQVKANDYLTDIEFDAGGTASFVRAPVRFDGRTPRLRRAPLLGEHTLEVLTALGLGDDEIVRLQASGIIQ
jgi:crotonobetainyl-CoA:carnitine CoA-transferase CaiB-like acyl-CoA transferase